jgi:tetratricopeptide (TPR) repeat protein
MLLALLLIAAQAGADSPAPPPVMAGDRSRYAACLALAKSAPLRAIDSAQAWRIENGGTGALHCLALAQFERKDYAAAFASFDAAAKASQRAGDGQAVVLLSQAADAALLAGQPEVAVGFLDRAIGTDAATGAISPRVEAALRVTRAEALVDLKRTTEAAADLKRATTLFPDVPDGLLLQATLARRMGDLALAETAILAAAQRTPDSAEVQYEAGLIAAAKGDMTLAKTAWTAAAAADPESIAGQAAAKALQAALADR